MLSRRDIFRLGLTVPLLGVAGCVSMPDQTNAKSSVLAELVEGAPGNRVPAAGYVRIDADGQMTTETVGFSQIGGGAFTTDAPFRVASISKLATAMTTVRMARDGLVDLDSPQFRPTGPSLREMLSHTSGIRDPDVYWIAHPGRIDDLASRLLRQRAHDGHFHYANINYGLAATILERAHYAAHGDKTAARFDRLAKAYVFDPLNLDAGFNWSGVSPSTRRKGATIYRETAAGWEVQVDGPETLLISRPSALLDPDHPAGLSDYQPGQNGTLFSPQGGLRASLTDLAKIARAIKDYPELTSTVWALNTDQSNGHHDGGYFTRFGTGVHLWGAGDSPLPGEALMGHFGEAYGLYAGAWYAPEADAAFAYAITGSPEMPPERSPHHPALITLTDKLFRLAAQPSEANKR